jgi:hypothetical protein
MCSVRQCINTVHVYASSMPDSLHEWYTDAGTDRLWAMECRCLIHGLYINIQLYVDCRYLKLKCELGWGGYIVISMDQITNILQS